jgi:hypothetical protein
LRNIHKKKWRIARTSLMKGRVSKTR